MYSGANNICATHPDPFNDKYGWTKTSVVQKIPVFNEQLLRPFDTIIPIDESHPNGARATVSCKFKNTYF